MDRLYSEIRSIIAEVGEVREEEISGDAMFVDDFGFDSMLALEVLALVEKKFKIQIPEERLVDMKNLNATVAIVQNIINNGSDVKIGSA